ncbi:hypothetical protein HYT05_05030 [Candidatus Kaiserbacteria bacterium]|nr:hypothetical protein [Candidatus Kaiserbacteria bacterium]
MQNAHHVFLMWEWLAGFAAVIFLLCYTLAHLYGTEARRAREAMSGVEGGADRYRDMRGRHFWYVGMTLTSFLVAVYVIEKMASLGRAAGDTTSFDGPHLVHYALDVAFFVCLGIVLRYNGLLSPDHGKHVRRMDKVVVGVVLTGGYLFLRFCLTH